jgi:hypothetical protein
MKGWPYEPSSAVAVPRPGLETEHEAGYCPTPVAPAAGPMGTLVLPLEARDPKVGGSLVAVGKNGQVRPGWPVGLKRAGAEFWAVAVGPDGITYALAVEPEVGGKSSESYPRHRSRQHGAIHDDHRRSLDGRRRSTWDPPQPLGSTITVTSGVMPLKTLIATL